MKRILVVDGDMTVRAQIGRYARLEGYDVAEASDGYTAVALCRQSTFDFVILAVMLPELDGFSVCQTIRSFSQVPILILSERGDEADRIRGLELGADDYVVKPFDSKEVVARIKAVLRRCNPEESGKEGVIQFENLSLDMSRYELKVKGKVVEAPPKELELLAYLAGHPNRVFTRDQLLDEVWGFEYYGDSRTIDVHIKRLREKLEGASEQWSLKTVWGVGYKFEAKD